jgi:primosomal protein N' (replication factor Y)
MKFYEVLVATMAYHGSEALTYSAEEALVPGAVVKVALRNRPVLGIILREVTKPTFDVKPIASIAPFPAVPAQNLELLKWMYAYYPAPLGAVVRLFVPPTEVFPKLDSNVQSTELGNPASFNELPRLTDDQSKALETIQGAGTFLLHGITGSGKSRVYVELTKRAISAGTSALVLTPEIGLTAQLTQTFRSVFGDAVFVMHSQQTAAERRNIWYEIVSRTTPCVVIGPRSALFSPIHKLGLIVLDEVHDNAYKNESAPHYLASRVAAKLASLHGAPLVLGSATPSVEDYFLATERKRPIISMTALAKSESAPVTVRMVDMRRPEAFTRSRLISTPLLEAISSDMARGEQSLLFLNRRGTANVVLCNVCGWQSLCPNCDLGLTYHGDQHELRCHICGFKSGLPAGCPECGNADIVFKSIGTKAIVDELNRLLPHARVHRFDTDTKKAERIEHKISSIHKGEVDVIVGTQMVGKGLDLPKLSTVGIINADSSLLIPDYTAAEQTYQLISQVAGRVGRGHRNGTVIVQTYDPENATLAAALTRDWSGFYQAELAERKTYNFPPYTYMLKLRVLRATSKSAQQAAEKLAAELASTYPTLSVEGPAASFHPREATKYSWQLLVKSPSRQTLVDIIAKLPSGWNYDIDPINLL